MASCLLGCNVSVLVRVLSGLTRACLAVAHPWEGGVWQLQCNRTLVASPPVLTELAVWWA